MNAYEQNYSSTGFEDLRFFCSLLSTHYNYYYIVRKIMNLNFFNKKKLVCIVSIKNHNLYQ